jgi:hypothetical protein
LQVVAGGGYNKHMKKYIINLFIISLFICFLTIPVVSKAISLVTTMPVSGVTDTTATLNANTDFSTFLPSPSCAYIIGGFDYGIGTNLINSVNGVTNANSFSVSLTGLNVGTKYSFHAKLNFYPSSTSLTTPCAGTEYGNILTFSTYVMSPSVDQGSNGLSINKNLYFGQRDPEVTKLQEYLILKKYLSGQSTGYYGIKTRVAVKKLQAELGIIADGFNVGPKTRAALKKVSSN